jgi:hypothetical protein
MLEAQPQTTMDRWAESMGKHMEAQREQLRSRPPEQIAHKGNVRWQRTKNGNGIFSLTFFQMPLQVHVPDYTVHTVSGDKAPTMIQALVTAYLLSASGVPRAGNWIAFRELPGGMFYHQAFSGYTGGLLVRTLGDDLDAFKRGSTAIGGTRLTGFGDAAYEFQVLPRIWVSVVYWLGDDEDGFPPQANVLFDRAASEYMIVDGLAIIGSHLTRKILDAARTDPSENQT